MTRRKVVGPALKRLLAYVEGRGWRGKWLSEGLRIYEVEAAGPICEIGYLFWFVSRSRFRFHVHPTFYPSGLLTAQMAEYLCRANLEIPIGNFEVCDDRGLFFRFKSGLDCGRGAVTPSMLEGVIDPALAAFDRFFPGLAWVVAGKDTPANTIRRIKSGEGLGKGFEHALPDAVRETGVAANQEAGLAAFECLPAYLLRRGWEGRRVKGRHAYCVDVKRELVPIRYFLDVDIDRMQFHFAAALHIAIPKEKRLAVAQFCCYRNFPLEVEHFDFNVDDGQIGIRSGVDFRGAPLSFSLIDGVVEPVLHQLKYFSLFHRGLMSILREGRDPIFAAFNIDVDE